MQELSSRTSRFTDSVIRRMTRICMQHDAINLSQGFPDFDPPRVIRRVGWVRCMRCQRFHFSGNVVAVRLCSVCGGAGGWPVGADPDADA